MKKSSSKSTKWLECYLHVDINKPEFDELRNFLLLWNLFEAELFSCDFRRNKNKVIKKLQFDELLLNEVFIFMQNRYSKDNVRFSKLKIRTKKERTKILQILQGGMISNEEKIYVVMTIIYRYRNNLFHGNKTIANAAGQTEMFEMANKFLISCLDKHQDQG